MPMRSHIQYCWKIMTVLMWFLTSPASSGNNSDYEYEDSDM